MLCKPRTREWEWIWYPQFWRKFNQRGFFYSLVRATTRTNHMNSKFNDTPSLLEQIRKRPQMWHGGSERSALLLSTLFSGITAAEEFYDIEQSDLLGNFNWQEFESWVAEQYNPKKLTFSSFSLASHKSNAEPEAFDLWYSWYDKFCKHNIIKLQQNGKVRP